MILTIQKFAPSLHTVEHNPLQDLIRTPRVKICCIKTYEEAVMAIRHGASALGFVSAMPSGPGPIPEELTPAQPLVPEIAPYETPPPPQPGEPAHTA